MPSFEAIVESHIQRWFNWNQLSKQAQQEDDRKTAAPSIPPPITVSTAHASGAKEIIKKVADQLGYQILDREIMDGIYQSMPVQKRIIDALDKGDRTLLPSMPEQIFTKHYIDDTSYLKTLTRIVRFISLLGPVIFIGRGTAFILEGTGALNIRIVADFADRVERLRKTAENGCAPGTIEKMIEEEDLVRRRFIKMYFNRDIDDPTAYHLVINTSRISPTVAKDLILDLYANLSKPAGPPLR